MSDVERTVPLPAAAGTGTSLEFHVNGPGFAMTRRWIHEGRSRWRRREHGTAALRLREFDRKGPHAWIPGGKLGAGVSINFIRRDALALHREFQARGIQAGRPFVGNGMWVTSPKDPDGYQLHFENVTDAPEDTEYAG